jgi:hypothetical protein
MKREIIYVAGPITALTKAQERENVIEAIKIGIEILKLGHYPFIPHLNWFMVPFMESAGLRMGWQDFMDWDEPCREFCDSLYFIRPSRGADKELERTIGEGKRIYYSLDEIKPYHET